MVTQDTPPQPLSRMSPAFLPRRILNLATSSPAICPTGDLAASTFPGFLRQELERPYPSTPTPPAQCKCPLVPSAAVPGSWSPDRLLRRSHLQASSVRLDWVFCSPHLSPRPRGKLSRPRSAAQPGFGLRRSIFVCFFLGASEGGGRSWGCAWAWRGA